MPGAPGPGLPKRGGRSRRRIAALVVACAVVIGGGTFAVAEAVTGTGPGTPAGTSAAVSLAASGPTGQAATLNGVLADASSAAPPAVQSRRAARRVTRRVALRRLRRARRRLRRALVRLHLLGGMHGQYTFETKKGPRTLAFERGTISKVAGDHVTVRANDGTTWTWVLTGVSVVREDGVRASATTLAAGQRVFAGGQVSGSMHDARLIVIRAAAKTLR